MKNSKSYAKIVPWGRGSRYNTAKRAQHSKMNAARFRASHTPRRHDIIQLLYRSYNILAFDGRVMKNRRQRGGVDGPNGFIQISCKSYNLHTHYATFI